MSLLIGSAMNVPTHVAIIMDGNGRWAQQKGFPRTSGHQKGLTIAEQIIDYSMKIGVKYLSLFVFSTENWKRPKTEIDTLFFLAEKYIDKFEKKFLKKIRIVVSGDIERLPPNLCDKIKVVEQETANNDDFCVNLCINYGGMADIVQSCAKLVEQGKSVTENNLKANLYNSFIPNVDVLIRTGGQKRLSNFMLVQCAYAELFFTNTLWPDFSNEEYNVIISEYQNRTRNFGGIVDAK